MMSEKEKTPEEELEDLFNLKKHWDTDEDNIGEEVYTKCLKRAEFYRGETGFFSDSVLGIFAPIAVRLAKENITMELLCSPNIKEYVRHTLLKTISDQDKQEMLSNIGHNYLLAAAGLEVNPNNRKFRQMLFAYLVAKEKLNIKFGIMKVIDLGDDLLHYKRGYFKFEDGSIIVSYNDWSEEVKWKDNVSVEISSSEVDKWIQNNWGLGSN